MSSPLLGLELDEQVVDPDDVVHVTGERRAEDRGDPDGVLVEVRRHVVGADRVLALGERDDPGLDVEVAAELLPDHVHVAAEDQVRLVDRQVGRLAALLPLPLQGERAEHDRLGRPLRAAAGGLPRRVEEVGQHPDAALLDLGRDRVLGVVDEVAVQVLGDDPLRLRLHPGRHEGGQVACRVTLEGEVLADQPHRVGRTHPGHGEGRRRHLLGQEAVAEEGSRARRWERRWPCLRVKHRSRSRGSFETGEAGSARTCGAAGRSTSWSAPPTTKQTAPAKVPQSTRPRSIAVEVAGRVNAATPARKNSTDPSWLTATIHQPRSWRRTPGAPVADLDQGEVAGDEEADAPDHVREPDPAVGLSGGQVLGERRHQADPEEQRPGEQHGRTEPADLPAAASPTSATAAQAERTRARRSPWASSRACSTET